jgi:hypothetical protein
VGYLEFRMYLPPLNSKPYTPNPKS